MWMHALTVFACDRLFFAGSYDTLLGVIADGFEHILLDSPMNVRCISASYYRMLVVSLSEVGGLEFGFVFFDWPTDCCDLHWCSVSSFGCALMMAIYFSALFAAYSEVRADAACGARPRKHRLCACV